MQTNTVLESRIIDLRKQIARRNGILLAPYQKKTSNEIIKGALKKEADEYILFWARQSGKTECLTITNLTLAVYHISHLKENFSIGIFAPANSRAIYTSKDRLQRRFKGIEGYIYDDLGIESNLGKDARTTSKFYLYCPDTDRECQIHALSADRVAHIKGMTFNLIQLEQSEDMDSDKLENDIFPMLAQTAGIIIHAVTSTENFKNAYIYDRLMKDPRGAIKLPINYDVTYKTALEYPKCLPGYPKFIEKWILKVGKESDSFRTQFGLEWVLARNKLISFDELKNYAVRNHYPDPKAKKFGGVDIGKENDSTVATVGERSGINNYILGWLEEEGTDYEDQADNLAEFFEPYKPRVVLVESNGPGDPVEDMFKKRLSKYGIRVKGWVANPKNCDITGKELERELNAGRLFYPATDSREQRKFIEQMCDCEKAYSGNLLKLQHPKGKDRHDDYVKSCEYYVHASLSVPTSGTGIAFRTKSQDRDPLGLIEPGMPDPLAHLPYDPRYSKRRW